MRTTRLIKLLAVLAAVSPWAAAQDDSLSAQLTLQPFTFVIEDLNAADGLGPLLAFDRFDANLVARIAARDSTGAMDQAVGTSFAGTVRAQASLMTARVDASTFYGGALVVDAGVTDRSLESFLGGGGFDATYFSLSPYTRVTFTTLVTIDTVIDNPANQLQGSLYYGLSDPTGYFELAPASQLRFERSGAALTTSLQGNVTAAADGRSFTLTTTVDSGAQYLQGFLGRSANVELRQVVSAVPEPSMLSFMLLGLVAVAAAAQRRRA